MSAPKNRIVASPRQVTLGDTSFTVKNRAYRYQDVLFTKVDREMTTTTYYYIPVHKARHMDLFIALKNRDLVMVSHHFGTKSALKKMIAFCTEFLQRSFKYRWDTYFEDAKARGFFYINSFKIYPDGSVFYGDGDKKHPQGTISKDMMVSREPGFIRIGDVSLPTATDPDILETMLDVFFEIKCP